MLDNRGELCGYIVEYDDRIRYTFYRLGGALTSKVLARCGLAQEDILCDFLVGTKIDAKEISSYRQNGKTFIILLKKIKE